MIDLPAYEAAMTAGELALLAVGGGLYTVGAVIYALKRPNPWPAVFGYHEVFHTLVVAAALCHWVAVWLIAASRGVLFRQATWPGLADGTITMAFRRQRRPTVRTGGTLHDGASACWPSTRCGRSPTTT